MKVIVLRKCFVGGKLWDAGTITELPESIDLNSKGMDKNFRPVDIPAKKVEALSEPSGEATESSEPEVYISDKPAKPKKKRKSRK